MNEYPNIKTGTIVIVKEDNSPPMRWPLGRVTETIPGPDGKIRVVDVKTASGIYRRAVHLLAPLPVDLADNEEIVTQKQAEDHPDDENDKRSRKRRASRNFIDTAKVLLLTTLLLLVMTHAAPMTKEPAHIQTLDTNKAGIYFERIGKSSMSLSYWNLLVYYDLTGYFATVQTIEKGLVQLKRLNTMLNHNEYYTEIIHQYQHQLQEIKNGNILLKDDNNLKFKSRSKRSPFDIVGTVANKLFGIFVKNTQKKLPLP